jgi:hypothetical protein
MRVKRYLYKDNFNLFQRLNVGYFRSLVVIPKSRKFAIFVTFRGCSKNYEIRDFWFFGTMNSKDNPKASGQPYNP